MITATPTSEKIEHRPLKVRLLIKEQGGGGVEAVFDSLCRGFAEMGHDSVVWSIVDEGGHGGLRDSWVPISVAGGSRQPWRLVSNIREVARRIDQEQPGLLIAAKEYANTLASLSVRIARHKPRLVLTRHVSFAGQKTGHDSPHFTPLLYRYIYRNADAYVAVSQGLASELSAFLDENQRRRLRAIPNPVIDSGFWNRLTAYDPDWPYPAGSTIITVGRLSRQKGVDVLLEAVAQLPKIHLVVVGDGEERSALEAQAEQLGITGRVSFLGYVNNPLPLMAKADLFVLASRWEGFGNVIVEALAAGTPVVATDCPHGPREILSHVQAGKLAPPEDPQALAKDIITLIDNPEVGDPDRLKISEIYSNNRSCNLYKRC